MLIMLPPAFICGRIALQRRNVAKKCSYIQSRTSLDAGGLAAARGV